MRAHLFGACWDADPKFAREFLVHKGADPDHVVIVTFTREEDRAWLRRLAKQGSTTASLILEMLETEDEVTFAVWVG